MWYTDPALRPISLSLSRGEFGLAYLLARRILQHEPAHPTAHQLLGVLLTRDGLLHRAIDHLEQAVQLKPDDPSWRTDLALALLLAKRPIDAIAHLKHALALDPNHRRALAAYPRALRESGLTDSS